MTPPPPELADARVLVTGAGGFIGSHLTQALVRAGCRVVALVHYRSDGRQGQLERLAPDVLSAVKVLPGDVRDAERMREAARGCELIFHLAALIGIPYSYCSPRSYLQTNVLGTLNLLEAARANDVARLVHTSTSETYGTARALTMTEDHALAAQSPYAASKIAADMLATSFQRSFGCPVVTLRPFNTYGPGQSARAIVPSLIAQALSDGPVRVGNTTPVRDFTFVEDTAAAFLAAARAEHVVGRTLHVGTGRALSIGELAGMILERCGRSADTLQHDPARVRPAASEVDRLVCDPTRARDLLGWEPRVELEQGLDRTIAWVQEHRHEYRPDEYAL